MGAAISNSSARIDSSMSQTLKSTMTSEVDARITSECQNTQIMENVKNCTVKFAKQSCKSSVIGDTTSDVNFVADVQQTTAAELAANAKSSVEGLQGLLTGSVSNSNTLVTNAMNASVDLVQAFTTTCSRNAVGANLMAVRNTECTPENAPEFAEQDIDTSVISNCAVSSAASSKAVQDMKARVAATSDSAIVGVDLNMIFLIVAVASTVSYLAYVYTNAMIESKRLSQNPIIQTHTKIFWVFAILALICFAGTVISFVVLWYVLPFKPAGECPVTGAPLKLSTNIPVMPSVLVAGCTPETDFRTCSSFTNYSGCGVVSCPSPEAITDLERFKNAFTICSMLGPSVTKAASGCSIETIAKSLFPDNNQVSNCSLCQNGTFVAFSADPDVVLQRCKDMVANDNQALRKYFIQGTPCDIDDPACVTKESDLHPSDCAAPAYQSKKKMASRKLDLCKRLDENMPPNKQLSVTDTKAPQNLLKQCRLDHRDFFKCTEADSAGNWSCQYGSSDACKNGYASCQHQDYLNDLKAYQNESFVCSSTMENRRKLNWIVPFSFLGGFVLFGAVAFMSWGKISVLPNASYSTGASAASSSSGPVSSLSPFGLAGAARGALGFSKKT